MRNRAFSRILVITFIIIIGGILIWQYFFKIEEVEAPGTEVLKVPEEGDGDEATKLTLEALENAEYYFPLYKKRVRLTDGLYGEEEMVDEGGFPYIFSAGIAKDNIAFGDLNNDGKEDAAVILYSSGGSIGLFYELAIVINDNGSPYYLVSEYLGDRIRVNSINIQDEIITLEMLFHDVSDAACCPTLHKVSQYRLSGNELLEI